MPDHIQQFKNLFEKLKVETWSQSLRSAGHFIVNIQMSSRDPKSHNQYYCHNVQRESNNFTMCQNRSIMQE